MSVPAAERIEIVRATQEHVPKILELARSRSLEAVDPDTASRDGFLVALPRRRRFPAA
ncbi:hypothetical protein ACFXDH_31290 [Streptomyces sp. NPDC059467]|uniref:hypothetical protein n=1 Tax=Streptomyces sp. NPDC059467 TaxID=3346844 RepID=UPI0036CB00ED